MKTKLMVVVLNLLAAMNALASNLDSTVCAKLNRSKPYIIINIPSTECITCRVAAANIIAKTTDKAFRDKIVLLSDSKNMSFYYNQFPAAYDNIPKIYDKNLSDMLSRGPFSTISLVTDAKIQTYQLTKINSDTINYFNSVITQAAFGARQKIDDSVFSDVSRLFFNRDQVYLFNDQFQVALSYNLKTKKSEYVQPKIAEAEVNSLYQLLAKNGVEKLTDAKFARQSFIQDGLTEVSIYNTDLTSNSALFKLYTNSMEGIHGNDTILVATPEVFLALNTANPKNAYDLSQYEDYIWLDSIHYNNMVLDPLISVFNHKKVNDDIFMPYWDADHSVMKKIDGKDVFFATEAYIVKLSKQPNKKAKMKDIYKIAEAKDGPGTYKFYISDDGYPIILSKKRNTINLMHTNEVIPFSKFAYSANDTLNKFFDISITHDTLKFVAETSKNFYVKGTYNIKNKTISVEKINTDIAYQNMKISDNDILACAKDENKNQLIFDMFSF